MGGIKHQELNDLARELWLWCMRRKIWVFAEYVASAENPADEGSRITNLDTEWELTEEAFQEICTTFRYPTVDLFATRNENAFSSFGPYPGGRSCIRQAFERLGLGAETVSIMMTSVADSTIKQYSTALKYWWEYCVKSRLDPYLAEEHSLLDCLTKKFLKGAAYGTLTSFRAAVSLISSHDWANSVALNRFFKGVFRSRPTAPKYAATWDVASVLKLLESWGACESLDLRKLTLKLTMLLALGSAFRVQSLVFLKLENIKFKESAVEVTIPDFTKTSRPGAHQPYARFPEFQNKQLCIATALRRYIDKTANVRGKCSQLQISFQPPHGAVTPNTVSRWLRLVMKEAGVEEQYTAHSTRHASTSAALRRGVSVNAIKSAAGWSEKSVIFNKFYNRQIKQPDGNFALAVMDNGSGSSLDCTRFS
ncbi:uncharacterized protein LOC106637664 [Copidosoma floridanum]|uniref:uncharacterized protein LOC106637664 n=1 Tax=Copidosoma floridanum TaxID=29053 RepID=UPI0006C9B77B|nr:uncharacterized protein LOC106637664 [Copidosoma floridanum]